MHTGNRRMNIKNTKAEYDVMGIGSALLDFTVMVEYGDLERLGLKKGEMLLIEADRSREILGGLAGKPMDITPGGSSANTLAGISVLGGKGIFLGSVGNDSHGDRYIEDTELIGVKAEIGRHDSMTGHAITFITPDSERTFATHLGASLQLNRDDGCGIQPADFFHADLNTCTSDSTQAASSQGKHADFSQTPDNGIHNR